MSRRTRPAEETDATKGACARSLSKHVTSVVDTRTRRTDPFASIHAVGTTLRYKRSRDANTTPSQAITLAVENDEVIRLPRPGSGRECLTVRDGRRIAACHRRYVNAGETHNADVCGELLETDLPTVLDREYVTGP